MHSFPSIHYLFMGGGFFLGLFISLLLFVEAFRGQKEKGWLALVMLFSSVNLVHPHLESLFGDPHGFLKFALFEPSQYLIAPLLYFYIRHYSMETFKHNWRELLHFIPFVAVVLSSNITLLYRLETAFDIPLTSIIYWALLILQGAIYLGMSQRILKEFHGLLEQDYSSLKGRDLSWLAWLFRFFILLWLVNLIPMVLLVHSGDIFLPQVYLSLVVSLAIWGLGLSILLRKSFNSPVSSPQGERVHNDPVHPKYVSEQPVRNLLNSQEEQLLKESLINLMEVDKYYLNPNLSLDDLTKPLGFSRNEISWVINQRMGKNFYLFINEFRVEEVIGMMKAPSNSKATILTLAMEGGFNSKPAFNKVFKQVTGKTPSEYRRSL